MKPNTEKLLTATHILAWIVCIGLIIKAGSVIISYVVSIGNPEAAKDLYMGLDLSAYRYYSFEHYTFLVGYKLILYLSQAYVAFLLTILLSRLNISKPFNTDFRRLLYRISYSVFCVWLVAIVYHIHTGILEKVMNVVQHS